MGFHRFMDEVETGVFEPIGSFGVFHKEANGEVDSNGEPYETGWYWWACFKGYLPDSDPTGPYDSEQEAIDAAQDF